MPRNVVIVALSLLLAVTTGAAAEKARHWYTPWRKPPPEGPVATLQLRVAADAGLDATGVAQFWSRNQLRIDLATMPAAGALTLRPVEAVGWPVRIEFAVRPGTMAQLEVQGDKRVVFIVPAAGAAGAGPLILQLGMGVYTRATKELRLSWR
jgi:hypothetical protein